MAENGIRVELEIGHGRRAELAVESADEFLRDDLRLLQRRRVMKPPLETERPGEPVWRHRRQRRREIRAQHGSALSRWMAVVRQQRPQQTAAEELEGVRVADLLRVEGVEVAPLRPRHRISLLVARPTREAYAKRAAPERALFLRAAYLRSAPT